MYYTTEDTHYFGKPDLPKKEGYYIARGHVSNSSSPRSQPKFSAEFYIDKSIRKEREGYFHNSPIGVDILIKLFTESIRRFKKETDEEFQSRVEKKWSYHFIFYYHKDGFWDLGVPIKREFKNSTN